jgi:hypothetical protein
MHVTWPTIDSMNPQSPSWRNPFSMDDHEEEPLAWDSNCPFVTAGSLYGSPGLEGFGASDYESRKRRSMVKVALFMGLAAGAFFLLASDVFGLRG